MKNLFLKYIESPDNNELILSQKLISQSNIIYKKVLFHIGFFKKQLSVKYLDNWPDNTIGLSKNLSNHFTLPESIEYKIRFEERNIFLGPVICLLFSNSNKRLTSDFSHYNDYLINYNKIKGLVFICSNDGISIKNKTISGYFYNPNSDNQWIEGVFPYPDALYRRVKLPLEKYNSLISCIGDNIFNSYRFNKLEFWECISKYKNLREYIPYTEKLLDVNTLLNILEKYESVYLKKIAGQRSLGLFKVIKSSNSYKFISSDEKIKIYKTVEEVSDFLKNLVNKKGEYIIQQALTPRKFDNRNFDLRVIIQKDESGKFTYTTMIGKLGRKDSITTVGAKSCVLHGKTALKSIFNLSDQEATLKEKAIVDLCIKVSEALDKSIGNCADLGFDVLVDKDSKVWILEVNTFHDHKYPIYLPNGNDIYLDVVSKPLRYACELSNFEY